MSKALKIAITGANGFLGSHLVDFLLNKDFEVHCIVRSSSNIKWLEGKKIFLHRCGLEAIEPLKQIFENVDYIFHFAGTVSAINYKAYHHGNVSITKNVLDAALLAQSTLKRIVITSSLAVGGPCTKNHPIDESLGFNPLTQYGKSKVAQEKLCELYMPKLPISIARPSVISGEREPELYEFIKTVKNGMIPLVGFKNKYVGIINVKDLTKAFYDMALSKKTIGKAYYLSSEEIISWKKLAKICAKKLQKRPLYLHIPHIFILVVGACSSIFGTIRGKAFTFDFEKAKEGVQEAWICKVQKAQNDFNFKQETSIQEGVEEAIDWYIKNKWL